MENSFKEREAYLLLEIKTVRNFNEMNKFNDKKYANIFKARNLITKLETENYSLALKVSEESQKCASQSRFEKQKNLNKILFFRVKKRNLFIKIKSKN